MEQSVRKGKFTVYRRRWIHFKHFGALSNVINRLFAKIEFFLICHEGKHTERLKLPQTVLLDLSQKLYKN